MTKSVVLVLLLGTMFGCRSYGGYGSEEALYRQIQRATDEFAHEFEQMQQEQPDLEAHLTSNGSSAQITVSLGTALSLHGSLIEEHRELVESLSEGSSHRALSRAYGAIISDQQVVRRLYRRAREAAATGAEDHRAERHITPPASVMPTYYRNTTSSEDVASLATGEPIQVPGSAANEGP